MSLGRKEFIMVIFSFKTTILLLIIITSFISACDSDPAKSKVVELKQENSVPLTWQSENTVVIDHQEAIYLYDINDQKLLSKVADYYDSANKSNVNCFSPNAGLFAVAPATSASPDSTDRFRFIPDWKNPNNWENPNSGTRWSVNPLDCTQYNIDERDISIQKLKTEGSIADSPKPLLKSDHGESFLVVKKEAKNTFTKYLKVVKQSTDTPNLPVGINEVLKLDVDGMSHGVELFAQNVESFYDESENNYLIYETTQEFDKKMGQWPLAAWRITPNLNLAKRYALPPGPWVKNHSFLKELSCFSCGCACYSHISLSGNSGKIYAHVWGKAVDDTGSGIFRLDETDGRFKWTRLYSGNFSNRIIVSPDGCTLVFSDKEKSLKKMNACASP